MSHTQGKLQWYWRVDDDQHADCGIFTEPRPGHAYSVCRAPKYATKEQWEANARRLVACWNASVGVPTEEIEHFVDHAVLPGVSYDELKAQRDELLAALRRHLVAEETPCPSCLDGEKAKDDWAAELYASREAARAAIANATKGTT